MWHKISTPYNNICPKCNKTGFIPNTHEHCLECLKTTLRLKTWDSICLQCGEKNNLTLAGKNFCLRCVKENKKDFEEQLIKLLNKEQKELFEKYQIWEKALASMNEL